VWGTGPGVVAPFLRRVNEGIRAGHIRLLHRHRVDDLVTTGTAVTGVQGKVLAPSSVGRGVASARDELEDFELRADAVVITTGGIGGNHDLVRAQWPATLGAPPRHMLSGVPASVDGRGIEIASRAGARLVNGDRMWHYTEGITNYNPAWASHGIRILPGPSSVWLDATGKRLPAPLFPGFDTLGTLEYLRKTGHDHSWFVLTQKIIEKEFALSGSEQNPDLTDKDLRLLLKRVAPGAPGPVEAFKQKGEDFVVAQTLPELIAGMQRLAPDAPLDAELVEREIRLRDGQLNNDFSKDPQITAIRGARKYVGDKLIRVALPHRILDPKAGPLIAVKLHILTRKSLGGIQTDLSGRALDANGVPVPGLYAAGEASGFGGGGMHGYRSLEGTFLGGCLFTGRTVGRAISAQLS
jgi:predicted oxidoreductase